MIRAIDLAVAFSFFSAGAYLLSVRADLAAVFAFGVAAQSLRLVVRP